MLKVGGNLAAVAGAIPFGTPFSRAFDDADDGGGGGGGL